MLVSGASSLMSEPPSSRRSCSSRPVEARVTVADVKQVSRGRAARSGRRDRRSPLTAVQVAQHVRRALGEVTGLEVECVTALESHDDWR
jgi:hypothetical protein